MYENAFKNLSNTLRQESGCSTELDYTEQTSWLLFLKYLGDREHENQQIAEFQGSPYTPLLDPAYQWSTWANPDDKNTIITGKTLIDFVRNDLFPNLAELRHKYPNPDCIHHKIGEVFGELTCKFTDGYLLRDSIDEISKLSFGTQEQRHELSILYEDKIKSMGNAGRNGGEYYTPRPLIKAMIRVLNPQIGETIYDPACGSAGFLCESYEYLHQKCNGANDLTTLQNQTLYGKEKKTLPYIIAIMNLILHGVEVPNIVKTNTLEQNILDIDQSDQYNIILANPPFGGKEQDEIKNNFTHKNSETAYLFLQHFMKSLKTGGRAGVVITNTFLTNGGSTIALRRDLLTNFNLHTILEVPDGAFTGTGAQTIVLFFEKGTPTQQILYYQPDLSEYLGKSKKLGKTTPLLDSHFDDFVATQKTPKQTHNAWIVDIANINTETYDLAIQNPNAKQEKPLGNPSEILAEIRALDEQASEILVGLNKFIGK